VEVLDALAGAEVNPQAGAIHARVVESARVGERQPGGGGGEAAVGARIGPAPRVVHVAAEVEVPDLGGEPGRERAGVKRGDRPDAAAPLQLAAEEFLHVIAQGGDNAHPGDDHPPSHRLHGLLPSAADDGRTLAHFGGPDLQEVRPFDRPAFAGHVHGTGRVGDFVV
jgi:hypothetical protein